ncbi:hypothetical protein [Paenibacillus sp. IITD108]|uniref:hypothetical protein n=1 Tax=Paenibacillus sp. IITD108 TaxID=3116649 RepID=UPI002F429430
MKIRSQVLNSQRLLLLLLTITMLSSRALKKRIDLTVHDTIIEFLIQAAFEAY